MKNRKSKAVVKWISILIAPLFFASCGSAPATPVAGVPLNAVNTAANGYWSQVQIGCSSNPMIQYQGSMNLAANTGTLTLMRGPGCTQTLQLSVVSPNASQMTITFQSSTFSPPGCNTPGAPRTVTYTVAQGAGAGGGYNPYNPYPTPGVGSTSMTLTSQQSPACVGGTETIMMMR